MLFKVFTVLCAISLLGGFANCQTQNDEIIKLLAGMLTNSATDTNKNSNENQVMQLLVNSITESMKNTNQNDQAVQTLVKMLAGGADTTNQLMQLLTTMANANNVKTNDNQLVQLLTTMMNANNAKTDDNQMMKLLTTMMNANNAKTNDNQLMQLLTTMMNANNAKTSDNQLMQLLTTMMNANNAKTSDNQMMQLLTTMMNANNAKTSDNQMMQMLTMMTTLMGGNKDTTKTNENQMMQLMILSMLGGMTDMNKNTDMAKSLKESIDALYKILPQTEQNKKMFEMLNNLLKMETSVKPGQCMAAQKMMTPVKTEVTAWVNMLKTSNMKSLFGNDRDYDRFVEMLKYVEGSQSGWLNAVLRFIEGNDWVMTVVNRMLDMMLKDKKMQEEVKKFIQGNKDVLEFTLNAMEWMKTQNFSDASPLIKKIVPLVKNMDLKSADMDKAWFDNYMSWVDCTFGKEGEIQTLMRSVGMLSKVDMLAPLLKGMMGRAT